MKLRVTQPFGNYNVGDEITDEDEIASVSNSGQSCYVVQVSDDPKTKEVNKTTAKK